VNAPDICECCGQVLPEPTTILGQLIRNKRVAERLSVREAGREAKMSFSTIHRIERGEVPAFVSFCRAVGWLGLSMEQTQALIKEFATVHREAQP
jgi:transcriptional regulator with XRE-family HTH domain